MQSADLRSRAWAQNETPRGRQFRYWSSFRAERHRPFQIEEALTLRFGDAEDCFRWLLWASDHFKTKLKSGVPAAQCYPSILFYAGSGLIESDYQNLLPDHTDSDLVSYCARVTEALDGQAFGIQVVNAQAIPALWPRVLEFFRGYYQIRPFDGSSTANIFLGTYQKTPFGVHLDAELEDSFQLVLAGHKKFLFWNQDNIDSVPELCGVRHTLHYEPYLPHACSMEAKAGDMVYWPEQTWHVAEGLSPVHAAITFGRSVKYQPTLAKLLGQAFTENAEPMFFHASTLAPDEAFLGAHIERWIEQLQAGGAQEVVRKTLKNWLRLQTALGFWEVPEPCEDAQLQAPRYHLRDLNFPVVFAVHQTFLLVGAAGRVHETVLHADLLRTIERINAGQIIHRKELRSAEHVELMRFLLAQRLIEPGDSSPPV